MASSKANGFGKTLIVFVCLVFMAYFCVSAVQGNLGVLRRMEYEAQEIALQEKLDFLSQQIRDMENKTRRMSDESLDLELLDQQIRDVLGRVRPDEIVIH